MLNKLEDRIIQLFNNNKKLQDDGLLWAVITKEDLKGFIPGDLCFKDFMEFHIQPECRGFMNDEFIEINEKILNNI